MRGIIALSPSRIKFKRLYPIKGSWGTLASSTPKKLGNYDNAEGETVTKEKTEPMVAFNRPSPFPQIPTTNYMHNNLFNLLTSGFILTIHNLLTWITILQFILLTETWSSRDSNDD
ncbi:unnamed protein product [Malus baccata var. baccata]